MYFLYHFEFVADFLNAAVFVVSKNVPLLFYEHAVTVKMFEKMFVLQVRVVFLGILLGLLKNGCDDLGCENFFDRFLFSFFIIA
jgi:hypothetical protein